MVPKTVSTYRFTGERGSAGGAANCLLAAIFIAVLWSATQAQERQSVTLRSTINRPQPMTGIVLWTDHDKLAEYGDAVALEYRYCGYDEVVDAEGNYDFGTLDRVLNEIAGRNHQAVLRFNYCYVGKETTVPNFIRKRADYDETVGISEGKKTHFCDWSNRTLQEFTLEFYTQLAKRYDNDPRIAFLQTGFGLWGEYHIYDGPREMGKTFPTKEYQATFLKHLDGTFTSLPWSISVDAADYDYTPLEDNEELLSLGFGVFDDSFLCKQHPTENAVNWGILGPNRWKSQPAGGEFSYYNKRDQKHALRNSGPNGVPFQDAAKQFHISYMIGNDQPRFQPIERIRGASMATGYRFHVKQAQLQGSTLHLEVGNEGVAPIYRDAYFSVGNTRASQSLKGLLPGESLRCTIDQVRAADIKDLIIHCGSILKTQSIQFEAAL